MIKKLFFFNILIYSFLFSNSEVRIVGEFNINNKHLRQQLYFEFLYIDFYNNVINNSFIKDIGLKKLSKHILDNRSHRSVELINILNSSISYKEPIVRLDGKIDYQNKNVNGMFKELKKIKDKKTLLSYMCIIENSSFYNYQQISSRKKGNLYLSKKIEHYENSSLQNLLKVDYFIKKETNNNGSCCKYVGILCPN